MCGDEQGTFWCRHEWKEVLCQKVHERRWDASGGSTSPWAGVYLSRPGSLVMGRAGERRCWTMLLGTQEYWVSLDSF
jgi:hypothetical protein